MAGFEELSASKSIFTDLDAELLESLVALASEADCADGDLAVNAVEFLERGDRVLYARLAPGVWPAAADRRTDVVEIACRRGRGRADGERESKVFLRFRFRGAESGTLSLTIGTAAEAEWAEELLARAFATLARSDGDAEVYVPPPPETSGRQPHAEADPRGYYQKQIDGLVVDLVGAVAPQKSRVAELGGGDGSVADQILCARSDLAAYVLLEGHAARCELAAGKLEAHAAGTAVEALVVDATDLSSWTDEFEDVDVFVALGSLSSDRVGAPAVFRALAAKLRPGGCLVITGLAQTILHPRLVDDAGLVVERASVSSDEAGGLASGFGRFHLWVLRKPAGNVAAEPSLRDALLARPIGAVVDKLVD